MILTMTISEHCQTPAIHFFYHDTKEAFTPVIKLENTNQSYLMSNCSSSCQGHSYILCIEDLAVHPLNFFPYT